MNAAVDNFSALALSEVTKWIAADGRADLLVEPPIVRKVQYDYLALTRFFSLATTLAASVPAINGFWIDDRTARVVVSVDEPAVVQQVDDALAMLGIPLDGRRVEVDRAEYAIGLQDVIRPVHGGIQVNWNSVHYNGSCTSGFSGWRKQPGTENLDSTYRVLTTNSHCTTDQYRVTPDQFGQPYTAYPIGYEVDEAPILPGGTGYDCLPAYYSCRYADVAVIRLDDSVASVGLTTAWSTVVSEGANPPYYGQQAYGGFGQAGAYVGDWVHKVGRTTGQSSAYLDVACADKREEKPIWNLCSMAAPVGAKPGDSGGTVFRAVGAPSYRTRIPVGIVWGKDPNSQRTWISSIGYVEYALNRQYIFNW